MVNGTPRRRSWLLIALIVSIGANLFFGSWMLGRWFAGPPLPRHVAMLGERGGPGADSPGRSVMRRMAASVPAEHRAEFEAVMTRHRDRIADAAAQAREARGEIRDAIIKEPFDRAALDKAFATLRARNETLQSATQAAIAEAASSLPPEARRRLVDWRAHGRGP
jgi:Spy/CpxP family protein refolding chaperone